MLRNYLKIAWRNLWRNRIFSLINLSGLALGIMAFVFILQYISYEYSYNRLHKNLPNLYRVLFEAEINGELVNYAYTPPGLAPLVKDKFSDVRAYCRVTTGVASGIISYTHPKNTADIRSFRENKIAYVDGSFFDVFDFPIAQGDAEAIKQPNQVALSRSYSQKFFGRENPIGQTLTLFNQFGKTNYTVGIVFEDFPPNSDLQYEILLSMQTLANPANLGGATWAALDSFDSNFLTTFFLLNEKVQPQTVAAQMNVLKETLTPESQEKIVLQSCENIHLGTSLTDRYMTSGSLGFVYLIAIIGILILSIAWLNYVNLSTAISLKRAKEVGIRKVIGARKSQLIVQFLGESLLLNSIGIVIALLLIEVFQGYFNEMTAKPLSMKILGQQGFWLYGILFVFFGALASGAYTAFNLSSFKPVKILKGVFTRSGKGLLLRKVLVIFQFAVSIALIASTFLLYKQLRFMQNTRLGMNPEQLMVISGPEVALDTTLAQKKEGFTNDLAAFPFIERFSRSGSVPSNWYNFNTGGITKTNAQEGDERKSYAISIIDHRYVDTYEIPIVAGENFRKNDCVADFNTAKQVLINEKAAKILGFTSPQAAAGQLIRWGEREFRVKGVLEDYHHQSLQSEIDPMIFIPQNNTRYFTLRMHPEGMQKNIETLKALYESYFPGNPFEYFFMDVAFDRQYQAEVRYGRIFSSASLLAILIACLGLFGLAAFTVEQRTKEIGIRKVMGASLRNIVGLVTRDFMRLVLISFLIATPVAWYFTQQWLEDFAYRTEISWWVFVLAGALAFVIAFLTIVWHSLRAASSNPVEVLRNE